MRTRIVAVSVIFYVAVLALLLGVLFKEWVNVVPKHLAGQIGHNTEGYLAALVVAAWIQFVRPRLVGKRAEWPITIIVALAFVGLTIAMLTTDWPSRFKTLNEGTLGAALVIPYVQLPRPFPRRAALWTAIAVFIVTAVTTKTVETTDMAETYVIVLFAVIGFDLIDRGILDPRAVTSAVKRWSWYAFLVLVPIVFSLLEYHWHAGTKGLYGGSVRFVVRVDESFIFALFVHAFFGVGLGRTGNASVDAAAPVEEHDPVVPSQAATV
jgi:hypothetical protein